MIKYSAVDVDAPLLLPNTGSLNQVLVTCLNTGYTGKSAAGWALPYYSNYDKVVFRNGSGSRQRYFQVLDNFVANPNMAALYGFETMSDVDTGTGKFPTDVQIVTPNYSSIVKSTITDQAARNWLIYADSKICYLLICPTASSTFSTACLYVFGDFIGFNASDLYNSLIIGRITNSSDSSNNGLAASCCTIGSTLNGHHAIRSYTQLGGSVRLGKHGDNYSDGVQFPNPVDGGLIMSPVWITETNILRGKLPGLWHICHNESLFTHGDTFSGSGDLAGRTFEIIRIYGAVLAMETSDTWYS